jgi:hypothetical protein
MLTESLIKKILLGQAGRSIGRHVTGFLSTGVVL